MPSHGALRRGRDPRWAQPGRAGGAPPASCPWGDASVDGPGCGAGGLLPRNLLNSSSGAGQGWVRGPWTWALHFLLGPGHPARAELPRGPAVPDVPASPRAWGCAHPGVRAVRGQGALPRGASFALGSTRTRTLPSRTPRRGAGGSLLPGVLQASGWAAVLGQLCLPAGALPSLGGRGEGRRRAEDGRRAPAAEQALGGLLLPRTVQQCLLLRGWGWGCPPALAILPKLSGAPGPSSHPLLPPCAARISSAPV